MACSACKGEDKASENCAACMGRGEELLTCCPYEIITPDVDLALRTARSLEMHAGWPNGGGWLDESQILVDATEFATSRNEIAKADMIKQAM